MVTPLPRDPLAGIRSFIDPRRQALLGLASGLMQGNDWGQGFGMGFERAAEGRRYDDAYAETQKAEAERQRQLQETIGYLRTQQGGATWADAVERGFIEPKEAFQSWYDETHAPKAEPTANMRDFQFAQENPDYAEFLQGGGEDNRPSVVREYEYARQNGFEGTFTDYQSQVKRAPLDATTRKELLETDEGIEAGQMVSEALDRALALNETAYDGPFAAERGYGTSMLGDKAGADTLELQNLVTAQALDQLKATFGSMPTEGERKILLEIQGSVGQPREVRRRIFERAKKAAERRIKFNMDKAAALRGGDYFDQGYTPYNDTAAPAGGDDVESILSGYGL